jgi:hypothetical protein
MATQRQIGSKHPSRDTDSIGFIWAVDPVANDQRLMKSVDPWAGAGGPGPRCRGHILRIFLKEMSHPKILNFGMWLKYTKFLKLFLNRLKFVFRL